MQPHSELASEQEMGMRLQGSSKRKSLSIKSYSVGIPREGNAITYLLWWVGLWRKAQQSVLRFVPLYIRLNMLCKNYLTMKGNHICTIVDVLWF